MGSSTLTINGKLLQDFGGRRGLFVLLDEIEQSLDYDIVYSVDGEKIN